MHSFEHPAGGVSREPAVSCYLRFVREWRRSLGLCFQEASAAATPLPCWPFEKRGSCQVLLLNSGANGSLLSFFCFLLGMRSRYMSSRRIGSELFFPPCRQSWHRFCPKTSSCLLAKAATCGSAAANLATKQPLRFCDGLQTYSQACRKCKYLACKHLQDLTLHP